MTGFFRGRGGFFQPLADPLCGDAKNGDHDHQLFNDCHLTPYDAPVLLSYPSRSIAAPKRTRPQREHSVGLQVDQRPEHLSWLQLVGYVTRFLLQSVFEATLPSLCAQ